MPARRRLDAELVRRGLATSRADACTTIAGGRVLVNGAVADKSARLVAPGDAVVVAGPPPRFVGRGGEKLDAALDTFSIDVSGVRALDVGASTGGFTDCLLQRGAAAVVALDVGHGQLHPRIRDDPRVLVLERTNIRDTLPATIGGLRRPRRGRRLVHLAPGRDPRARHAVPAWELHGAAGQTAVRGRAGRGRPRSRRHHRPGDPRARADRGDGGARARPGAGSPAGRSPRSRAARATANCSSTPRTVTPS